MELTQAKLKQVLNYNPVTGVFTRISYSGNNGGGLARLGQITQNADDRGYMRIRVYGKKYKAHRLAWLFMYGKFPQFGLDHINRNKLDNRICNLREATQSENSQNQSIRKNKTSKYIGVHFCKTSEKWKAQIQSSKQKKCLGYFDTEDDAYNAYLSAKKCLHTFHTIAP